MFKIALVQNLSELRNYPYADIRRNLTEMNFEVVSVTRDNLDELIPMMNETLNCILFSSNSLGDAKIYEYVCGQEFIDAFDAYTANGGNAVILHQIKLRDVENPLPFLGLEGLTIKSEYKTEESGRGAKENFLANSNMFSEHYFAFPNKIDLQKLGRHCITNSALEGYYWTLLQGCDQEWRPILEDKNGNRVISRMHDRRVIFSSMLLDYQGHFDMLENILINLMTNHMSLAILDQDNVDNLGFNYFLNSLESKRLYYKRYQNNEEGIQFLLYNMRLGIHSAVLINANDAEEISQEIKDTAKAHGVKLIQVKGDDRGADSFRVHSVDRSTSLDFGRLEMRIEQELASGYIGNSFMKTVEVLMRLMELQNQGKTRGHYDETRIQHALEKIYSHIEKDGSFDQTFGASCKALWVFENFLGSKNKYTQKCKHYVENYEPRGGIREEVEKYIVLAMFQENPKEYMRLHCQERIQAVVDSDYAAITEFDFLSIMRAALIIGDEDMLMELLGFVQRNTKANGEFFDLYTTSVMSTFLIDFYNKVENQQRKNRIRRLLFELIMYMQSADHSHMSIEEEVQYVCALYEFESEVSFPVSDITELILSAGRLPREFHNLDKQIRFYEKSRESIDALLLENDNVNQENKALKKYRIGFYACLTLAIVLLYVTIYLLIIISDAGIPLIRTLFGKIKDSWLSLFTLIIVPVASYIYKKFLKK